MVVGVTVAVVVVVVVDMDVDVDVGIVAEVNAVVVAVDAEEVPRGIVPVVVLGVEVVPAVGRRTDAEAEVDVERGGCPVVVAPVVADAEGDVDACVEKAADTVEGTTAEGRGEGASGR